MGIRLAKAKGPALPRIQSQNEVGSLKKKTQDRQQRQAGYDKGGQENSFSAIVRRLGIFLGQWEDADLTQRAT